jgi:hypothetical protein
MTIREIPILFSAPMVRAILSGRKTQTRRALKPQPKPFLLPDKSWCEVAIEHQWEEDLPRIRLGKVITNQTLRWAPGDHLWIRETFSVVPSSAYRCSPGVVQTINPSDQYDAAIYRASFDRSGGGIVWRPSIHMPRWASRITLDVTAVRIERLQDISEADAQAEGAPSCVMDDDGKFYQNNDIGTFRCGFAGLWDTINGPGAWDSNPWVAVIEFRRSEVANA